MEKFQAVLSMDDHGTITLDSQIEEAEHLAQIPYSFSSANQIFDEARGSFVSYEKDVEAIEDIIVSLLRIHGYDSGPIYPALYKLCVPGPGIPFDPADFLITIYKIGG